MRMSELPAGRVFTVRGVRRGREVGKRLADMGFTEGAKGRVLRKALFFGPLQVEICGYELLVRRSEAELVEIEEAGHGS